MQVPNATGQVPACPPSAPPPLPPPSARVSVRNLLRRNILGVKGGQPGQPQPGSPPDARGKQLVVLSVVALLVIYYASMVIAYYFYEIRDDKVATPGAGVSVPNFNPNVSDLPDEIVISKRSRRAKHRSVAEGPPEGPRADMGGAEGADMFLMYPIGSDDG
ncbi:uncharacterized protein LOC135366840 isoform X2 [Ornithodoros turicata]|uniref:uncharacterized protein LOC135366840 isoform X2 n=1 Tax=Ornithodoros turicata TaxID=34597 RepID=UPI00313899B9